MVRRSRILLLTPNWHWDKAPMPVDTLLVPIAPPLEFSYLFTELCRGADVHVIDAYASHLDEQQLGRLVAEIDPTAVVVTTTPTLLYWRCPPMSVEAPRRAISVVRQACSAAVTVIGPHGTSNPAWTLSHTGADWCYRGAFERELPGILLSGGYSASRHVASPHGQSGGICVLAAQDLPRASFDWIPVDASYTPHMWSITEAEAAIAAQCSRGVLLEASRGCPWACAYCAKAPVRDKFARRPLDDVEAELEQVTTMGADYVFFIDETFNIKSAEFDKLLELLRASALRFGFQGRPDLIDDRMASQLRDAGCVYVELGIDTVSDSLSSKIGRRQVLERTHKGLQACRDYIPLVRFNRLNLQTSDYREIFESGREDWDYPPDPAFPYPGAAIGEFIMRKYDRPVFDWDFARRYSWWLRIEVFLQRSVDTAESVNVRDLQKAFLELPDDIATVLATALGSEVRSPASFHELNKIVMQRGPGVRTRSTRS